ncbi:T9SS type A sorting domain-containing protein [Aureisphaera sp. CAU 1614]|uniref:T9SS type A sorting domain-containing protein n=1 Tax=Halomarinibacterium sedimenti TaxID=2857106 RepID=A0A9X1FPE8_9FLAO|nr:T9SS type A sorting domain-containing protein [Halomarinibacterium sedimenti]MBW2938181.1 T9SS type A sorting domain-containing protein [Halomarinibacterium sedimenti]
MRKILLINFLLLFSINIFSQDYKPLLDTYNEWNVRFCYEGLCDTDLYYTNGDTIVDGMSFKVLDGYHYISRGFLLREDINSKKVYLKAILPNGVYDYLLYDFSLEVGDSIDMKNPITPFPEDAGYFKVDSIIPRPLVDGNTYDHFYFSPAASNNVSTNNAIWVEGVGSLSIITAPSGDPDIDGVGRVACVFKNGESYYSDLDIIDECEPFFILDTPNYITQKNSIKAIKTSEKNIFQIINIERFSTIELYDLKGVHLNTFENNSQHSIQLNVSNYPSGIYLLILNSSINRKQTLKIVIE